MLGLSFRDCAISCRDLEVLIFSNLVQNRFLPIFMEAIEKTKQELAKAALAANAAIQVRIWLQVVATLAL